MTHPQSSPRLFALHIRNLVLPHLEIADLRVDAGQVWCVLGENGAGKSQLGAALSGALPDDGPAQAAITERPERVSLVSFEAEQALYERDLAEDDSNFLGGGDLHGDTALEVLQQSGCDEATARALAMRFGAAELLDRQYRRLSSGEARRILVLRAVATRPDLLLLDEPFESLDPNARAALLALCEQLLREGQALMLLVNRRDDVARFVTHLAVLHHGRVLCQGTKEEALAELARLRPAHGAAEVTALPEPPPGAAQRFDPLLELRNAAVRYEGVTQFESLSWTLRPGEHTLILGENGCGKSTLLQLISGDHPQCYTNDLHVFGYRRGSGESIWDIKQHIGLVSPALHRDYRASASVLETVISGLYDSIGVYCVAQPSERRLALAWLELLGMSTLAAEPLRALSYGQQRLVLIARALIKQPPLVILDEPTQGLDDENRQLVLAFMARLAALPRTTLLFVSHRHDEHLPLFLTRLRFERSLREGVRYDVHVEPRD